MIKAAGVHDGLPLLVLGLTGENMARLMADEPIVVDTAVVRGGPCELPAMRVLLVGGRDEKHLVEQLKRLQGEPGRGRVEPPPPGG